MPANRLDLMTIRYFTQKLQMSVSTFNSQVWIFLGGSPISKHESSGGEYESDEKNPDIIPQPVDSEDPSNDYIRKRQHISTIETSPSRSLLHQASNSATPVSGGYMGYCTLRNGMPLHELTTQSVSLSPLFFENAISHESVTRFELNF